jgi:hypothetical protein
LTHEPTLDRVVSIRVGITLRHIIGHNIASAHAASRDGDEQTQSVLGKK